MAYSSKLCNPTPFPVKIHWHRGIYINIPEMGETQLTPAQLDDFRPGRPGYSSVKELLDYHGLFVYDTDLDYDVQAYEALKTSLTRKEARFKEAYASIRDRRAAEGSAPSEETMNQLLESFGFTKLQKEIEVLKEQVKVFEKVALKKTKEEDEDSFDPLTVYCLNPPRKFPSETQLNFFLNLPGNEHIKAQHLSMVAAHEASRKNKQITKRQKIISSEEVVNESA